MSRITAGLLLGFAASAPMYADGAVATEAQLFAEGVISTPDSFAATFTPDGRTIYFCRSAGERPNRRSTIMVSHRDGNTWTPPQPVPFSGEFNDFDPMLSPDGARLFFSSVRPETGPRPTLWVVEKTAAGDWGTPRHLTSITGVDGVAVFPCSTTSGNLYFAGRRPGLASEGDDDIYVCRPRPDGSYGEPENLGRAVNSPSQDYDAYVAPDESFLIFCSKRPGGIGPSDFYVSVRENGVWTAARNLGPKINSATSPGICCPSVSPDGKWFYFTSGRNGRHGIYRIEFDALGLVRSTTAGDPGAAQRTINARVAPAQEPVLFGDGAVKGSSPTFSRDGTTVFTHLYSGAEKKHTIMVSHFRDGHWTPSEVAPFSGVHDEMEPAFSADGRRLVFASHRPVAGSPDFMRLWVVANTADNWSEPSPLPVPTLDSGARSGAPSLAASGSLYFGSLANRGWPWEIWYSRFDDGSYSAPVKLNDAINPGGRSWSHAIAPDESFLIFAGVIDAETPRPDSLGDIDLYVSFRENGQWQRGVNLGAAVNTAEAEVWPRISRDGRTLFFNRQGPNARGIYQIDLEPLLARLKSKHMPRAGVPFGAANSRAEALPASPAGAGWATNADIPVEFWQLPTGSRIAYLRFPPPNPTGAIPFIFLHGGPGGYAVGNYASARAGCERLAQRGFDVYLYDQVGSGFSNRLADPTEYTLDRHVADLDAIRQQIGCGRMVLLGASHGATLAANYLAAHPSRVEKAIFVSPGALDPAEHKDEVYPYRTLQLSRCFLRWIRDTHGREAAHKYQRFDALLRRDVRAAYQFAGDAEMDALADAWTQERLLPRGVQDPTRLSAQGRSVSGMGWWVGEMTCWDEAHRATGVRAKLASCAVPALILRGDADFLPAVFADEYAATFRRSKLVRIPNAGHLIEVDQPEAYRAAIRAFLFGENDSSHALH